MLKLEEITTTEALEALEGEWSRLWERCPSATPFQSPEWLLTWWKHFGGSPLWTLALWEGGRLAGLAPLFVYPPTRQVTLIGNGISDYLDILVEPALERRGAGIIVRHLSARRELWDCCDFGDLPASSPLLSCLAPSQVVARTEPAAVCPVLTLPDTEQEFLAGLGRGLRRNLRRYREHLESAGPTSFERAHQANLGEFLEVFFGLHEARWRQRGEPGMLADPGIQAFHREAAARLSRCGSLRLLGLRHRDALGAALYAIAWRGRCCAYLQGFDPALDRFMPGTLMQAYAIEEAIREGSREFDFLRGREPYKYAWGARDHQTYRWLARPKAARIAA